MSGRMSEGLGRMSSRQSAIFDIYAIPNDEDFEEHMVPLHEEDVPMLQSKRKRKYNGRLRVSLIIIIATVFHHDGMD